MEVWGFLIAVGWTFVTYTSTILRSYTSQVRAVKPQKVSLAHRHIETKILPKPGISVAFEASSLAAWQFNLKTKVSGSGHASRSPMAASSRSLALSVRTGIDSEAFVYYFAEAKINH